MVRISTWARNAAHGAIWPSTAKRARRRKKEAESPSTWKRGCRYPVTRTLGAAVAGGGAWGGGGGGEGGRGRRAAGPGGRRGVMGAGNRTGGGGREAKGDRSGAAPNGP